MEEMPSARASPCSASVSTLAKVMSGLASEPLVDRTELHARPAPGRPEIDEGDALAADRAVELLAGDVRGGHVIPSG